MPSMLVTCPESAHLEELDYEDHPLGLLITGCSRFSPACTVSCARTCAARLDQKRRMFGEEEETDPGDADDFDPLERLRRAWAAGEDVVVSIATDLADTVIG